MTVKEYLSTLPKSILIILAMTHYGFYDLTALQHKVKQIKRDRMLLKGDLYATHEKSK